MKYHFDKSGLWDLEQVFSSRTIREFDSRFTSHMFGYSDCKAYYTDACLAGKLDTIKVPLLGLNALDDAFQVSEILFWSYLKKIQISKLDSPKILVFKNASLYFPF